ncbi:hypothetical protein IG631_05633 [Alternaria alternata]|nr:hypothetical protein IG631_05633 [Alternaria alternata]
MARSSRRSCEGITRVPYEESYNLASLVMRHSTCPLHWVAIRTVKGGWPHRCIGQLPSPQFESLTVAQLLMGGDQKSHPRGGQGC